MLTGALIRAARERAGLSQRALAERAGTSHSTIAAYETGAKVPRADTLDRIIRSAGWGIEVELLPRPDRTQAQREAKGRELVSALELAAEFPLRRLPRRLPPPALRPIERTPS